MKFFSEYSKMSVQLDYIKAFSLAMVVANISLGWMLFQQSNSIKTIIIPPSFNSQFEVVGNRLDNKYFETVGKYISQSILTISPNTIHLAFNSIENFISKDPDVIKSTKEYFIQQNNSIKVNNIYQAFYPLDVRVNFEHGKFSVDGMLRKNTGNVFISEERKVIEFDFIVENGRLIIKKFGVK